MHINFLNFIRFFSHKKNLLQILAAGFLGFCLSLYFIGWDRITDKVPWYAYDGDRLQHMTGANYFAQDEWRYPILDVANIHEPEGANIVYTDSIPIIAIIYKIYYKITNNFFNYFCLWLSLCFVLNATLFSALLNKLKIGSWIINLSGASIICTMPFFLMRFGHAALCGHFLIIATLMIYLISKRESQIKYLIYSIIVCLASLMVHVYLFAMCFSIHIALILKYYTLTNKETKIASIRIACSVIISLIFMVVFGHLARGVPSGSGGYGNYSMNLLSPFWPHLSSIIKVKENMFATAGQYEGYNYLGIGVLFISASAIILNFKIIYKKLIEHKYLFFILLIIFVFTLSNRVYLGKLLIVSYDIIGAKEIYRHFQSSGRFFWVIAYALIIASFVILYRYKGRRLLLIAAPLAAFIQFFEFRHLGYSKHVDTAHNNTHYYIYQESIKDYDKVFIYPYFHCSSEEAKKSILDMMYLNSLQNKRTNNGYLARSSRKCESQYDSLINDIQTNNSIFFMLSPHADDIIYNFDETKLYMYPDGYMYTDSQSLVNRFSGYYNKANYNSNNGSFVPFVPFAINKEKINKEAPVKLVSGFSDPESWGTWSISNSSKLYIQGIDNYESEYLNIIFDFNLFINEKNPNASIKIIHDSYVVYDQTFVYGKQPSKLSFNVKRSALKAHPIIELQTNNNKSPLELGLSSDGRSLGIALLSIEISPVYDM